MKNNPNLRKPQVVFGGRGMAKTDVTTGCKISFTVVTFSALVNMVLIQRDYGMLTMLN